MANKNRRPVGRPRANKETPKMPARDAILVVAANLFGEKGFAATTTREIAEGVGVRQPSLFYHFKTKDDILLSIIGEIEKEWHGYAAEMELNADRAAIRLYRLMHFDFVFLMTEPYGIASLNLLPEVRQGRFRAPADRVRNKVLRAYRHLIEAGIDEGDIAPCDLKVTPRTILGIGEAVWSWYRPSRSQKPERIATQLADFAMKALLVRPSKLESLKRKAVVAG